MRVPLLSTLLLLGACGPLVQIGGNAPAPETLLVLTASAAPRPYAGPARATIGIEIPNVPGPLQTLRLPVALDDSQIAYLAGATWADQPNRQFQRLLVDTLASSGLTVIDTRQASARPDRSLTGTLREFGLDVRQPQAMVRIRYDAQIAQPAVRGAPLLVRRFDAVEPVADQLPATVAAALNRAANRLALEVADWAAPPA